MAKNSALFRNFAGNLENNHHLKFQKSTPAVVSGAIESNPRAARKGDNRAYLLPVVSPIHPLKRHTPTRK